MQYREADLTDTISLAKIRGKDEEHEKYWAARISGYIKREHHPQKALMPRVIYIALDGDTVAGFVAGHLTERYGYDGELEWIDVIPAYRRRGIASQMLSILAEWFATQGVCRVCVDVGSEEGRQFYASHGATELNKHWMVWEDIKKSIR